MKIIFHANTLNFRGTTVAVTDYAKYNQEILGNESVIVYNKSLGADKNMGTDAFVLRELRKKYNVVGYEQDNFQQTIDAQKADMAYFIRAGNYEPLPTNIKTGVHSVFQFNEPHGDVYAYISEWLSRHMTRGQAPFVPHIVDLPAPDRDYRKAFNIRDDQIVIGRLGGYNTFDLPFVKKIVERIVLKTDKFVFLFMGTQPFISHSNVRHITETHDLQKKANFINTCDAMLHARQRGESFGLAIAEFLSLNKPVFAWNGGYDLNHVAMLNGSNTLYNEDNLYDMLMDFENLEQQDWASKVALYKPEPVMAKFKEVFLS